MFRRKQAKTEPAAAPIVAPRWQSAVDECLRLGDELTRLGGTSAAGPVQERLLDFAAAVRAQLDDIVNTVSRSGKLLRLTETLDVEAITDAHKRAQRENPDSEEAASLARQHASAQRLLNSLDDVDTHVEAAGLRIRELVLAAGELALTGSDVALASLTDSIDRLTSEAEALRRALAELR